MQSAAVPPDVNDLALACVSYVERSLGVTLDFTSDTLSVLDHYLAEAKRVDRPEAQEIVARAAAAYFGEVLRRRFECWWFAEGDDITTYQVRFGPVYLAVQPYALTATALGLGADDDRDLAGLVIDEDEIEVIGAHLAALPEVTEEEFTKMTTRFDVLEIVVDQLKARAHARGHGDVTFEDPDYTDA